MRAGGLVPIPRIWSSLNGLKTFEIRQGICFWEPQSQYCSGNDKTSRQFLILGHKLPASSGKSWDFHVEVALRTTLEENLRMIEESVRF